MTGHASTTPDAGAGVLPGPLVGAEWLSERLALPGVVVLDASVGAHRCAGRRIPRARCFDIDGAMSDHLVPLPHTMPGAAEFTAGMRALSVDDADSVVVYDTAGIYSSARAWWMLRAMGFDRVAVLDGGLPAWEAAGFPVESRDPGTAERAGDFTAGPRPGMLVGGEVVAEALGDPRSAVLDARSRERYTGSAPEPRAPTGVQGTITGESTERSARAPRTPSRSSPTTAVPSTTPTSRSTPSPGAGLCAWGNLPARPRAGESQRMRTSTAQPRSTRAPGHLASE
ncbi:sulfurtransferase [Streptomyces sp. NPDC057428]|uniref:sulfurtransferase n=1 Tax=Streptomyces sp. NPDC057428 TaxID=3346129 RepID=UPI0036C7CF5D